MVEAASQYIGHLGWLAATPKGEEKSRAEKLKDTEIANIEPDGDCFWIIDLARNCGLYESNGMGILPVSWSEIDSWMHRTGRDGIWIAETVRHLSQYYVDEYIKSKDPARQSPMSDEISIEVKRSSVKKQFDSLLRKFK